MNEAKLEFLKQQLGLPPSLSKKWRMSIIGLIGLGVMYFASITVMFFKPEIAGSVAGVVATTTVAWGGIVSMFVGIQGKVDSTTVAAISEPTTI